MRLPAWICEDQWGLSMGKQGCLGTRDFIQNLHSKSEAQLRKASMRILGQTHLLILESLLEKQEATGTPLGERDVHDDHFESLFYYKDDTVGWCHFGVLPRVHPSK